MHGLGAFARSLSAVWPRVIVQLFGYLLALSLLWAVVAPGYAAGLAAIGRVVLPLLEAAPGTRYGVENGNVLAYRPTWLPKQRRMAPLIQPLWVGTANFGVPLLAALILATPGWGWRRRGRALAVGLGLLSVIQIVVLLVNIVATQQGPVMSPDGPILLPGFSHAKQPIFYWLYYFFDLMGRGFFPLLIYLGLIALTWGAPQRVSAATVGRNDPCPCGSRLKFKRCCGA